MPDEPHPMFHPVWWQVNGELDQQGPGSDASTLRALAELPALPAAPRIADMGCGPGRQTLALARATRGHIAALDLLPPFLRRARARARAADLAEHIAIVQGDITRPPLPAGAFDLVWSEGAVYNAGFEAGLALWRALLRPGGLAAVTEVSWIDEPAAAALEFWQTNYPAMGDIAANCERATRAGYDVLGHFTLPASDWSAYFDPIATNIARLRPAHADDPAACAVFEYQEHEIGLLARSRGSYSYVFYLLQRA